MSSSCRRVYEWGYNQPYYSWNRDTAVPCIGKRPCVFEVAGDVDGRQKRRRVCTKPLLWSAIECGDSIGVQRLIRLGHDPTERYQGWTCLMKAAENGNESIISQLLLENVDFNAVNNTGRTAMSFAASPLSNRPSKRAH